MTAVDALLKGRSGRCDCLGHPAHGGASARTLWERVVEACVALGASACTNRCIGPSCGKKPGLSYFEQLEDFENAEACLGRALEADPRRHRGVPAPSARSTSARKDHTQLEALVTLRVAATAEPDELSELLWEQARFRRA